MFAAIEKAIERFTRLVAIIGGVGLLVAIIITCLSIIGKLSRRLLNTITDGTLESPALSWIGPILGEEELVQYAVGVTLFTALPWLTLQQGHITVNLLQHLFSKTINRLLDVIGHLFFTVIVYLIMTQQWFLIFRKTRKTQDSLPELIVSGNWMMFAERLRRSDESQILGVKLWTLYTFAELCIILLFIVSVFCLVRSVRELRTVVTNNV